VFVRVLDVLWIEDFISELIPFNPQVLMVVLKIAH